MIARKSFSVRRVPVTEVIGAVAETQAWDGRPLEADLLIVASGFEERALAFPRILADTEEKFEEVIVGAYQTNQDDNARRFAELDPLLRRISGHVRHANADSPEDVLAVVTAIAERRTVKRVVFDVSAASSNFIFCVVGALAQALPHAHLTILYAEAKSYNQTYKSQSVPEIALELPERGVASVWTNELFAGFHHDSAKSHIIAFPSLYLSRMARCLNFCGEAVETLAERNVTWVLPRTTHPEHEWRRERTLEVVARLLAPAGDEPNKRPTLRDETRIDCDVLSVVQAAQIVLNEAEARPGYNLFLVHMGSKLQAVGAALALAARREISLVYARPERFNPESYSGGVGSLHMVEVGCTVAVLNELRRAGQIAMVCADGTLVT